MTSSTITLSCPSCGGKLQITKSINRFACGYCGNEHIVHRESGIVYLEPIAEDIHHIRAGVDNIRGGVDKTAAELAIARLTKELKELEAELKAAEKRNLDGWLPRSITERAAIIISIILFIIGINAHSLAIWLFFMVCFCISLYLEVIRDGTARKMKKQTIKELENDIMETQVALTRNRRFVQAP